MQQILKALPEEDQRLIYYRYFKNQTQTETAKRLGTTQVQISRREKNYSSVCVVCCCEVVSAPAKTVRVFFKKL